MTSLPKMKPIICRELRRTGLPTGQGPQYYFFPPLHY
jgi:hypothetical protein